MPLIQWMRLFWEMSLLSVSLYLFSCCLEKKVAKEEAEGEEDYH